MGEVAQALDHPAGDAVTSTPALPDPAETNLGSTEATELPPEPTDAVAAPPATARMGSLPPVGATPSAVRDWFDAAADAAIPAFDGTVGTARAAAHAYALRAKSANTRRAYRAGARAWCEWCERNALPCLPGCSADIVAFLAHERGRGMSVNTVDLRRAAIRYMHYVAGLPVPTSEALVGETMAGMHRAAADAGEAPAKKVAATAEILRQLLAPIGDDLRGLRDRAMLLVGFTGALRRSELAAVRVEHIEARERGLRVTLPRSKGERAGKAVTVAIPHGATELCPVRALRRWLDVASIREGAVFRRIWVPPAKGGDGPPPLPCIGTEAVDPRTVARIIQSRAVAAGFGRLELGGHSLKRGALTTGMDRGVHPTKLKRLGRHRSYAVLDEYLEAGDPFDGHPLSGLL